MDKLRAVLGIGFLSLACGAAQGARPNDPAVTIPLEPLGFTPMPAKFMLSRQTMYTLHFVDSTHVLFTFNTRSLMPRLADADPDDDDRTVAAVLLELPTGKVLARTEWRTRDHDQYLWALGNGRFLLRVRTRLTVLDPVRRIKDGEAFRQETFLDTRRPVGYISVSPGDLLTVETVPKPKPKETANVSLVAASGESLDDASVERDRRVPVQIHFYRMHEEGGELKAAAAGLVYSPALINVPATADGFLEIKRESASVFDFDYRSHAGKRVELAAYDTSCTPRPYFVSRSEFIAFGCRGSADKVELSGFNVLGENTWVAAMNDTYASPFLVTAPTAGRFALSRLVMNTTGFVDPDNLTQDNVQGQEISVFQTHDGRVLFKVQMTPFQRAGQNFDLSPDGMDLVALNGPNLVIYKLPALSGKDHKELDRARAADPERNMAVIALDSVPVVKKTDAQTEGVKVGAEVMHQTVGEVVPAPEVEAAQKPVESEGKMVGDVPAERRKAPSLYDSDHPKPQ